MPEYKLILERANGYQLNTWEISSEYDHDINDINSHGKFDFYIVKEEYDQLGRARVGQDIGEEVAAEIGCDQDW